MAINYLVTALAAAAPVLLIKGILWARYQRLDRFKDLPQRKTSVVWGHLGVVAEEMKKAVKDAQWDTIVGNILESIGNPPLVLVDVRPFNYALAIIADHELAEQITRSSKAYPYSLPKSPTMDYVDALLGHHSLVSMHGESWRSLRRRFNPGFAPQHLIKLLPTIVGKVRPFLSRLDHLASTGEVTAVGDYTTSLTFDIIGMTTMDKDFLAQGPRENRSELINVYLDLIESYRVVEDSPIPGWILHPIGTWQRTRLAKKLDPLLAEVVRAKHAELAAGGDSASRSILSLSLRDVEELTPEVLQQTCDSLKTFLFAGHDTTSILLQWSFYELERSPRAAAALCAELDELFGPDPDPAIVIAVLVERGEEVMSRMTYTSAFIKEILRLYPPGGSARFVPPGTGFFVTDRQGQSYNLDGVLIYVCATLIQRDPEVYGPTVNEFLPERWLGTDDLGGSSSSASAEGGKTAGEGGKQMAPGAWRPFERGPRNCIGQELANIESKIILACVARRYEFTKVGLGAIKRDEAGERVIEGGKCVAEPELYASRQVTAKPVDGMVCKVSLKGGAKPRKWEDHLVN